MKGDAQNCQWEFRILSLNVWGLPLKLTPNKKERIQAIADILSRSKCNVVCLQELWVEKDFHYICKQVSPQFPYTHYYHSGVLGSGLAILSKHKIIMTFYHQWQLNGYFHMIQHADWFGGKGVALAKIKFNDFIINVYNAHLHAKYSEDDKYIAHRVVQAMNTGLFSKITSSDADISFFCADLNSEPGDICYNLVRDLGRFNDSFDAKINKFKDWGTCQSSRITFTNLEILKKNPKGIRLDHILFKVNKETKITPLEYYFPFEEMIPGQLFSYSDHEAIECKFNIEKCDPKMDKRDNNYDMDLLEALRICNEALLKVKRNTRSYRIIFFFIILLLFFHPLLPSMPYFFYICILPPSLCLLFYSLFMSTLWPRLETNGLLGAIYSLKRAIDAQDKIIINQPEYKEK